MTSAVDIHWSAHRRWVKTLGKVMLLWTSKGTRMWGGGNDIKAHWCWQIVNPKSIQPLTKLGHSWQGQTKRGGVKQVSIPYVRRNDNVSLPPWHGILPPTRRGTLSTHRGVASYPPSKRKRNQISQETRINSQSTKMCSPNEKGGQ